MTEEMDVKKFAIAVDGPAGSGKSTVAKAVAKALGIVYVDTGAMYRGVAYACIQKGIDCTEEAGVLSVLSEMQLEIQPAKAGQRIFLDGKDISDEIRTQKIGQGASQVAMLHSVRDQLGEMQRKMAEKTSVVMDGRDIGTYVLPQAKVKIYMNAGVDERAKRRMLELAAKGECPSFAEVRAEIQQRDENDMNREYHPLRKATDAVCLDTTKLSIEEAVEEILRIVQKKLVEV